MKLTKFDRSQKAHLRLKDKYLYSPSGKKNDILFGYHYRVYMNQLESHKVMSKSERKKTFNRITKSITKNGI